MQISRPTYLLLHYGLFAVLSQLFFFLLYIDFQSALLPRALLSHFCAPWLEYPLCSLALLATGAYLLERVQKNEASS